MRIFRRYTVKSFLWLCTSQWSYNLTVALPAELMVHNSKPRAGPYARPEGCFWRSRHLPIFTGRFQPTIVGTSELNYCVRNGNRWDLTVIDTGRDAALRRIRSLFFRRYIPSKLNKNCLANRVSVKIGSSPRPISTR